MTHWKERTKVFYFPWKQSNQSQASQHWASQKFIAAMISSVSGILFCPMTISCEENSMLFLVQFFFAFVLLLSFIMSCLTRAFSSINQSVHFLYRNRGRFSLSLGSQLQGRNLWQAAMIFSIVSHQNNRPFLLSWYQMTHIQFLFEGRTIKRSHTG